MGCSPKCPARSGHVAPVTSPNLSRVPTSRHLIPAEAGKRMENTAKPPCREAGTGSQQKPGFVSLMGSARVPAGKGKVRGHRCAGREMGEITQGMAPEGAEWALSLSPSISLSISQALFRVWRALWLITPLGDRRVPRRSSRATAPPCAPGGFNSRPCHRLPCWLPPRAGFWGDVTLCVCHPSAQIGMLFGAGRGLIAVVGVRWRTGRWLAPYGHRCGLPVCPKPRAPRRVQ